MAYRRLIPVLFLKNGLIVRSQGFHDFREFGNPLNQVERLSSWLADELIYIDITQDGSYDLKRDDHKVKNHGDILSILKEISKKVFMPLTFGGRILDFEGAKLLFENGADKVIINTGAYRNPSLIEQIGVYYGSQSVVAGIDVKFIQGAHRVVIDQGKEVLNISPVDYAIRLQKLGAGEIFLNSIDRDGSGKGYDFEIIKKISDSVQIPLIACGGAATFEDFSEVFNKTQVSAVAAGNIFNFSENAYIRAKKYLEREGVNIKPFKRVKYDI